MNENEDQDIPAENFEAQRKYNQYWGYSGYDEWPDTE